MTPKNDPEIRGKFLTHPFAEVIAEIAHARLSGSLRVNSGDRKSVIYFRDGRIAFAASNARAFRLYSLLIEKGKLTRADLANVPDFPNDFQLSAFLEDKGFLSKSDVTRLFSDQVTKIFVDVLTWTDGEWSFSHLARLKDGLDFEVKTSELLVDHARTLQGDQVLKRFRSLNEKFERSEQPMNGLVLSQNEAFVLSRAEYGSLTAAEIAKVSAMRESHALHVLYTMWLAGLLERTDWQPAFSEQDVAGMRSARLELRKEAKNAVINVSENSPAKVEGKDAPAQSAKEPEITITVDEYLARVENARTYYDMLGIEPKADPVEVKRAYFALAKLFHPDRFHSEGREMVKRVQDAFTEISQAHEALKDVQQRELYDYKVRTELVEREKAKAAGTSESVAVQKMQASEHFERGFSLLMDDEIDAALPFLARAVNYAPDNARYHAYYGKALAAEGKNRHKAEAEMQAALKIDPENATFRILLAEFFVNQGLKKRAEGELNRLLAIFPSNREAQEMLADLKRS